MCELAIILVVVWPEPWVKWRPQVAPEALSSLFQLVHVHPSYRKDPWAQVTFHVCHGGTVPADRSPHFEAKGSDTAEL